MEQKPWMNLASFALGGILVGLAVYLTAHFPGRRRPQRPLGVKFTYTYNCPASPVTKSVTILNRWPGAEPPTVILCPGDRVEWKGEPRFQVKFPYGSNPNSPESPFGGVAFAPVGPSKSVTSDAAVDPGFLAAYKYTVTVNDVTFDPHIIIMGGGGG